MKALDISKEELIAAVRKIDDRLALLWDPLELTKSAMNVGNIGIMNRSLYFTNVYSFDENKWFDEGSQLLNQHQKCLLNKFIDRIRNIQNNNQSQEINTCGNNNIIKTVKSNPFKDYTNHLAEILQEKNTAYGDSFTESVDKFGLTVIPIRLSDKFNRVCELTKRGELKENDESLADTLLDMAGYSILALKYLKEHKKEHGKTDIKAIYGNNEVLHESD